MQKSDVKTAKGESNMKQNVAPTLTVELYFTPGEVKDSKN